MKSMFRALLIVYLSLVTPACLSALEILESDFALFNNFARRVRCHHPHDYTSHYFSKALSVSCFDHKARELLSQRCGPIGHTLGDLAQLSLERNKRYICVIQYVFALWGDLVGCSKPEKSTTMPEAICTLANAS
ncbi:hypothetical protein BJX68DRAFT_241288 [Aspergillus pseudodeflectus]|uniref:Secreted protein n=1 Tax=Aspergillus pseudodeflectus TaxID=176178 RepID=A0ABR4K407_9EURO